MMTQSTQLSVRSLITAQFTWLPCHEHERGLESSGAEKCSWYISHDKGLYAEPGVDTGLDFIELGALKFWPDIHPQQNIAATVDFLYVGFVTHCQKLSAQFLGFFRFAYTRNLQDPGDRNTIGIEGRFYRGFGSKLLIASYNNLSP